ncbi:hypothetical protein GE09DRAFT_1223223 [Coniochaeta sp. 2T2.1]|nr:hypothetical protein GE09DRAFT_1223223 [Coniochaeta sp. 2T2.1]
MRPVQAHDFAALAAKKPILLLATSAVGPLFARAALLSGRLQPGQIHRTCPPEITGMIVAESLAGLDTTHFCLVQPQRVMADASGNETLLCKRVQVKHGFVFGALKTNDDVDEYDRWLHSPDARYQPDDSDNGSVTSAGRPFVVPSIMCSLTTVEIPARLLPALPGVLLMDIDVPAVIAKVEGGGCAFCGGQRAVNSGGGQMVEFGGEVGYAAPRYGGDILCPVCVGPDWALKDVVQNVGDWENSLWEDWAGETYQAWVDGRLGELGY